ncbi:MAG: helix-turn-helix transcriptional regulator [Alphaproteobacteria bacterium]|nr:helix-turn-helix transcriptional regulator [Alphaproteobacteria bacterium]
MACDIVEEIGRAQSTTAEHLRILEAAGIVIGRIVRPRVCCSLNPVALAPLRRFLHLVAPAGAPAPARRKG